MDKKIKYRIKKQILKIISENDLLGEVNISQDQLKKIANDYLNKYGKFYLILFDFQDGTSALLTEKQLKQANEGIVPKISKEDVINGIERDKIIVLKNKPEHWLFVEKHADEYRFISPTIAQQEIEEYLNILEQHGIKVYFAYGEHTSIPERWFYDEILKYREVKRQVKSKWQS